jgi:hypothetical protein
VLQTKILGMKIIKDRKKNELILSQEKYIENVLERFSMKDAKALHKPLAKNFKLSSKISKMCPRDLKKKNAWQQCHINLQLGV